MGAGFAGVPKHRCSAQYAAVWVGFILVHHQAQAFSISQESAESLWFFLPDQGLQLASSQKRKSVVIHGYILAYLVGAFW